MKKQTKIVLISAFAMSLLLVGCGPLKEGKTEVRIDPVTEPATKPPVNTPGEKVMEFLYENDAFRVTHVDVKDGGETATIKGYARVYEATVGYSAEDGHAILDKGFVTASVAAPEWGDFELTINIEKESMHHVKDYIIVLFEESAKDGTLQHELPIPVPMEK